MFHSIQVYTHKGHFTLIAGSEKEAIETAALLFFNAEVYKVKVFTFPEHLKNMSLDVSGGKLVKELI